MNIKNLIVLLLLFTTCFCIFDIPSENAPAKLYIDEQTQIDTLREGLHELSVRINVLNKIQQKLIVTCILLVCGLALSIVGFAIFYPILVLVTFRIIARAHMRENDEYCDVDTHIPDTWENPAYLQVETK